MTLRITDFRKQIKIEVIIGQCHTNPFYEESKRQLAKAISGLCGGCTLVDSTGDWVEDAGKTRAFRFDTDDLIEEDTVHIVLTTEENKFEGVYNDLQRIVAVWGSMNNLDINWVHCVVTESRGAHFNVGNK